MKPAEQKTYSWQCPAGAWTGRLNFREWGRKTSTPCLVLYFEDVQTGAKYRFVLFERTHGWRAEDGNEPDFQHMAFGCVVELTMERTEIAFGRLVSARLVEA